MATSLNRATVLVRNHIIGKPTSSPACFRFVPAFLFFALTLLPYLFSINHQFVYDDHGQIEENIFLKNPANFWKAATLQTLDDPKIINGRRPFIQVTYFIDTIIWKDKAGGFRLTNLVYHVVTLILLFVLIRRLARQDREENAPVLFAFFATLIFSLHPVLIEAVHMPSFRADIFYTLFTLGYLLLLTSIGSTSTPKKAARGIILALVLLLLALTSKESGVVAPALLVIIWWCFPDIRPRPTVMFSSMVASVCVIGTYAILCAGSGSFQGATGNWNGLSLQPPENFYAAPWIWTKYLRLILIPWPLIIDRVIEGVPSPLHIKCIVGVCAILFTAIGFFYFRRRHPFVSLALGWMLTIYLPVSNIVPLFNPMSDRLAYGMIIGFSMMFAYVLVYRGLKNTSRTLLKTGVLAGYCAIATFLTFFRLLDFKNDHTLWHATLKSEPRSARAHTWVGLDYSHNNMPEKALEHFNRAAELNPEDVSSLINAGILYGKINNMTKAEEYFREAIRRRPDHPDAHYILAIMLRTVGNIQETFKELNATLEHDSRHLGALQSKLALLFQANKLDEVLNLANRILEVIPDDPNTTKLKAQLDPYFQTQPARTPNHKKLEASHGQKPRLSCNEGVSR